MRRVLSKDAVNHIGKEIVVEGWVHKIRKIGGINFIVIRDREGAVQGVIEQQTDDIPLSELCPEAVIRATGTVHTEERAPLGVEIRVSKIDIFSVPKNGLPIDISKKELNAKIDTVLEYRALSLRHPKLKAIFKVEMEVIDSFRRYLKSKGFTEIHTPKIVATGTEGGANLFKIQYFDRDAYLAQSPQFYKQTMVGVFERVYEVGPVYRAEEHDTARHLNEFISLDFEMGFIKDENDIMDMESGLIEYMIKSIGENCAEELDMYKATLPKVGKIPRFKLRDIQRILEDKFHKKCYGEDDLDPKDEQFIHKYVKQEYDTDFAFISHFPTKKRPMYTMPDDSDPEFARSFDLLCNGLEITTGGQRIHGYDMLVESMKKHGVNPDNFIYYLQPFKYGMPPHGGLAIGAERLTARILGLENIREASLFPRVINRLVP
ncbi:MAG: aspartate--tRNA(Asn) ligase [Firmicutes bacterium]|nr:aspartate--tRNA(Asn) ligase [Bacillota bacterium]